jgi:predicted TIM-barrel fold metal-dependent hydrolase
MFLGHPVVDADSHKCENPLVFADFLPAAHRDRFSVLRDRYGEQRFCFVDRDRETGRLDRRRVFLQADGLGKGTFRPYHRETTIGGLFNRVRLEHMDREGIDHQVLFGSISLAFNSLADPELAVALCRAHNDYLNEDCRAHADRLHPVAVLPLQDPGEAVAEMHRCVEGLGMHAVSIAPHLPIPHPEAPDRFPALRAAKQLSHPDFRPIFAAAQELDCAIAIHGAPGAGLACGTADLLDTFTLVHVFANRGLQQMALSKLIFDGVLEEFPGLRFGFLEAGAGWLPDFLYNLREHWQKRVVHFDPSIEPSPREFLLEFARETGVGRDTLRRTRRLLGTLFRSSEEQVSPAELEAFRYEHPKLVRDPLEYVERGQVFLTIEPDDPAPAWLPAALGECGRRVCGMAVDYGHWDAEIDGCVGQVCQRPGIDPDFAVRLVSTNALDFYGDRLRDRIGLGSSAAVAEPRRIPA